MAEETLEAPAETVAAVDELRQPMLDLLRGELGADLVGFELAVGDDLCVRVNRSAWRRTAELCRDRLGLRYFCFLSGIDWQPNPDLLGEKAWEPPEPAIDTSAEATIEEAGVNPTVPASDAAVSDTSASDSAGTDAGPYDTTVEGATAPAATKGLPFPTGVAGGETRFQVFARLYNLTTKVGVTLKADLDPDDPRVDSLVPLYRGADWHEREAWEMYGFGFDGHPGLRHLYLPGEFEGHPLRKDFPLLARLVKPWPGLVDVEPMPGEEVDPDGVAIPGDEA